MPHVVNNSFQYLQNLLKCYEKQSHAREQVSFSIDCASTYKSPSDSPSSLQWRRSHETVSIVKHDAVVHVVLAVEGEEVAAVGDATVVQAALGVGSG